LPECSDRHPSASVLGTESDPTAVESARTNGVTVVVGDLFEGVPTSWRRSVDVIVGVLPYVPTDEIEYLPRDVRDFEPTGALDGGVDGLVVVRRAVTEARDWLRPGGYLLLEVGGDQPTTLTPILEAAQFGSIRVISDEDGDPRGIEALAWPEKAG